jgi:hypothetical protein
VAVWVAIEVWVCKYFAELGYKKRWLGVLIFFLIKSKLNIELWLHFTAVGNVGIGESCTITSDCSVGNTLCTESPRTCQCDIGFYDSNGDLKKGVCLPSMLNLLNSSIQLSAYMPL